MDLIAKYSSYRLGNIKIAVAVLLGISVWCVYDGYYNQKFIEKHTIAEGKADDTLIFHRYFAYFGVPGAIAAAGAYMVLRKKQLTAGDDGLILDNGDKILYKAIEELDHTDYDLDGKFKITYICSGSEKAIFLTNKKWDGLDKVLECLISKIS